MNTIAIVLIIIAVVLLIGSFSTFQKSAHVPLRKKSLNDLKETLPRSNKTTEKLPTLSGKDKTQAHK